MTKKIVAAVLVLMVFAALGAFAFEQKSKTFPWMASFNKNSQINLSAAVGFYGYGIDITAGPEYIITNFDISGIPLEFGVAVRGMAGFASFLGVSWVDWGVAPLATLHWGVDFGAPWKFDWYIGLGLGISGSSVSNAYLSYASGIGFGFASFDGVAWHFSDNWSIITEAGYTGYIWVWGIGAQFSL
jgi:hypothetical protein